jgi:signal transduction histidine kinase
MDEAKRAVLGIRSGQGPYTELAEAFFSIANETICSAQSRAPKVRVFCEGLRMPLHPLIRDEVYGIGREALLNALRHSRAQNIVTEVIYSSSALHLVICDDGCGISTKVVAPRFSRDSGVSRMRERADRIGARLSIWSAQGRGTEVVLDVPGDQAFLASRT